QAEQWVGIAGAERADHEVVHRRGILHRDHVLALETAEAQLRDRGGGVGQQALPIGSIRPGAGDDSRAVVRPDAVLVGLDQGVEGCGVDQAFLDQERFQSLYLQCRVGRHPVAVMLVAMVFHGYEASRCSSSHPESSSAASASGAALWAALAMFMAPEYTEITKLAAAARSSSSSRAPPLVWPIRSASAARHSVKMLSMPRRKSPSVSANSKARLFRGQPRTAPRARIAPTMLPKTSATPCPRVGAVKSGSIQASRTVGLTRSARTARPRDFLLGK